MYKSVSFIILYMKPPLDNIYTHTSHKKKLNSTPEFSFFYERPAQNLIILVHASSNCSIDAAYEILKQGLVPNASP